jgi:hypothetical protein
MSGKFSDKDPVRYAHYARFFSHLSIEVAMVIFWCLFVSLSPAVLLRTASALASNIILGADIAVHRISTTL